MTGHADTLVSTECAGQTQVNRARLPTAPAQRIDAACRSAESRDLVERLASIDRRSAEIAHEINNSLNAILLAAESALRFRDQTDANNLFKVIRDEALRAGRITRNALDSARAGHIAKKPEDLNQVVKDAVALATRYFSPDRLQCAMELADSLPPVHMNVTGIEQVLINLMKNAAEAGARLVRVLIRTAHAADGVEISVADDGPGIPPERLHDLFAPFCSTKHDTGGTGLGLSVSRRIIAEHGGQITVESVPSQGSVFRVRLSAAETRTARTSI